jgi:RHS repeat-associated protein
MSSYTSKGFTGQYADAVTGLDYYVSRYYDPVSGLFLSADKSEGNAQGMNPYAYVGGNPETATDPTGQRVWCGEGCGNGGGGGNGNPTPPPPPSPPPSGSGQRICQINGGCMHPNGPPPRDVLVTLCEENAACRAWTFNQSLNGTVQFFVGVAVVVIAGVEVIEVGGSIVAMYGLTHPEEDEAVLSEIDPTPAEADAEYAQQEAALINQLETDGVLNKDGQIEQAGFCSFTPQTKVETNHGEQAIGSEKIGEMVLAYNPKTKKMEYEPILHVWIHQDHDLVDLTLTAISHAPHSTVLTKVSETIHTNKKHPFFTEEDGFLAVASLKLGMHILQADGHFGTVTGWKIVPGSMLMYNLTVQQDHTYAVGTGQWVVHNDGCTWSRNITNTTELDPNAPSQLQYNGTISGGGRSGANRPLTGLPDSYQLTTGGHALVYDDQGRLIFDIDSTRVKMTVWDQNPDGQLFSRDEKLDGPVPLEWMALLTPPSSAP